MLAPWHKPSNVPGRIFSTNKGLKKAQRTKILPIMHIKAENNFRPKIPETAVKPTMEGHA